MGFLVNDQRDAQFIYLFIFLTLYMFRAHRAHHQETQLVSIQPLVAKGEFRPRQTRQLPRAVDLKGRLLSCQSY